MHRYKEKYRNFLINSRMLISVREWAFYRNIYISCGHCRTIIIGSFKVEKGKLRATNNALIYVSKFRDIYCLCEDIIDFGVELLRVGLCQCHGFWIVLVCVRKYGDLLENDAGTLRLLKIRFLVITWLISSNYYFFLLWGANTVFMSTSNSYQDQ